METDKIIQSRSKWRQILTAVALLALIILVYSLRDQIHGVINDIGKVNIAVLLLIIPLEALNYDAYARFYRSFFKIFGDKVDYWPMYKLNLELNFVNHILPSGGVSGISYFALRMRTEGVSGARATVSQVVKLVFLYTSFQILLVIGLFSLAIRGHASNLIILVATVLVTLLVVGTGIFIYIIEDRQRISTFLTFMTKALNKIIHLVRPKKPETINIAGAQKAFDEIHDSYEVIKKNWRQLKKPFLFMLVANATEVAAIYTVYIAFGELVNVGAVIMAYAVANFAGLISVLPAGIGIYEGLMTAVLAATGIPASLSIPVTLMYRVINMFIQLVPGYFFYQRAALRGLTQRQP